jgi:hypothetical protein
MYTGNRNCTTILKRLKQRRILTELQKNNSKNLQNSQTEHAGLGVNASDLYTGGARFKSRPRHRIFWQFLRGFPQSFQANVGGGGGALT